MDLEEWEYLSDEGFIDGPVLGKKVSSRGIIDMNYFQEFVEPQKPMSNPIPVVHLPIQLDEQSPKEVTKIPIQINTLPSADHQEKNQNQNQNQLRALGPSLSAAEQEAISQVFFKKMTENEFADMKMDSPKSGNRGFPTQINLGMHRFDGNEVESTENNIDKINFPKEKAEKEEEEKEVNWEENSGGLKSLKKWGMTGIGAICSFGFAAATICIIVLGSAQKEKIYQQNLKHHFQIYTDDKRIKQVVQHAAKLNDAISAARGAPLTRAHITVGGYFESL